MKRLALLGLLLLVMAGCIDYTEELWLNKDGSGRAAVNVRVKTNYPNPQELNSYQDIDGIELIRKEISRDEKNKYTYYKIEFRFKSLEAFNKINTQITNADFSGRINLIRMNDGSLSLQRTISLGSLPSEGDEIEQLIRQQPQTDSRWTYILHLPDYKIIKANADPANIDALNGTVRWEYQTAFLWNKSQTMTVQLKPRTKLLPLLILAVALLLLVILIWLLRHLPGNRSKRHPVEPETVKTE